MKTDKQRQAELRAKNTQKGIKSLSLGLVHESFHEAFKALAAKAKDGQIEAGDVLVQLVRDTTRENELQAEIDKALRQKRDVEAMYLTLKKELERRDKAISKTSIELNSAKDALKGFKSVLWRFYWKK
jgi:chromosome segregation ATPase